MFGQIISTVWKDLKVIFRDRAGMMGLFLMPLMLIVVMSLALQSLFITEPNSKPRILPVVNYDSGQFSRGIISVLGEMEGIKLVTAIDGEPITLELGKKLIKDGEHSVILFFPEDFSRNILDGINDENSEAALLIDPAVSVQYIAPMEGMLSSICREVVYSMITGDKSSPAVKIRREEITGGTTYINVDTYQQNVPGYAIMGVFFIVGTMASSIITEKREGTFRRLLAAPISSGAVLLGKVIPYYLVNLLQIALMFSAAHLFFGMSFGNVQALIVLSLPLAGAATGLGMMISALANTETQVSGISSLLTLTMSALGGCFMPISIMPDFLKKISRFIPHSWAMQGFQNVLVRGYGISDILPEIGILCAFALFFFAVGVWRFRFE